MKVDSRILIGLGVVVVGIIVYIIIKNSIKDDDDKDDNTKTNKVKLDRLEKALKNAGIDTLEDFTETTSTAPEETTSTAPEETTSTAPEETTSTAPEETGSTAPEETTSTKDELFEIVDLYFPKVRCVWEKLFDDGLEVDSRLTTFKENSDGKIIRSDDGEESLLRKKEFMIEAEEINIQLSLVYALKNDNIEVWYDGFIGTLASMSGEGYIWAKYDKDHEDPYSTLVLYSDTTRGTDGINKNTEDYVEKGWLYDSSTDEDGTRIGYIKYTAKTQFERNKGKINELKEAMDLSPELYNYMVQCNSD